LKVLHICPGYFQRQLYDKLFLALQSINLVNEIFALSYKNILHIEDRSYNIKVLNREFSFFERFIYFGKQQIIFEKICKEFSMNEFHIVHAHTLFSAGFSAYLLRKKFGLPYIVAIRNTDINLFFKYMFHLRFIGRTIVNNSKNIIFLSPSYRDYFVDKYVAKKNRQIILKKSVVIPNGINEYYLENKFIGKSLTNINLIKLIYIGEINSNKNIETTIKACKLLLEKGYSVNYTIVGEILEAKYQKIITKNSFINYHTKCPKEELLIHLRHSDIFIMPSINETFGLVYAEAMSQGLPIIYSKDQGFDGQFENGVVGYAVNCFDYKDIAHKIIDLYNNYQQFSYRCVSLVNKFSWFTIANEYKKIYK
jgi:glycosyltransferase involved in cell wall biosynthesis